MKYSTLYEKTNNLYILRGFTNNIILVYIIFVQIYIIYIIIFKRFTDNNTESTLQLNKVFTF